MSNTQTRLAALETKLAPKASARRCYVVSGGGPDDDPAAFIVANGHDYDDDADMILHLVGCAPSPEGAVRVTGPFAWVGKEPEKGKRQ